MNSESLPTRPWLERTWRLQEIVRGTVAHGVRVSKTTPASPEAFTVTKSWGDACCRWMNIETHIQGTPFNAEPCLYVANHVSYLDIPLLMSQISLTYIAKKEVSSWPIFGRAAESAGTVFVDRNSARSRSKVAQLITDGILKEKKSIGLFPEGTSSLAGRPWKRGAFNIAAEYGFPVQAIRIFYEPLRPVAFIDDDAMLPHLWNLLGVHKIKAHLEFFDPIKVEDADRDAKRMETEVRESFNKLLKLHGPRAL